MSDQTILPPNQRPAIALWLQSTRPADLGSLMRHHARGMSYAKKTNGFRRITVEGGGYRWCFRSGRDDSTVTLQGSESGGQQAIVTMRGVRDPWLAISDGDAQFVTVTPRVVRRMIQQALARGWQPSRRAAPLRFDFESHDDAA